MRSRRGFFRTLATGVTGMAMGLDSQLWAEVPAIESPQPGEDVFSYLRRGGRKFTRSAYCQVLGAANAYKEGDEIIGVSALNDASRKHARRLLHETKIGDIDAHPPYRDQLWSLTHASAPRVDDQQTLGQLKAFLLSADEVSIQKRMRQLSSDVIGCVVKLCSHAELIALGSKIFNPLPGSQIGAPGYLGARVQPNSPTDHPDDIRWQVFNAFSFAVGDVLLGTNPVSSETQSVQAVEETLREILQVFELSQIMPHCVLSHIDVQAEVEASAPGTTALWFQSIAGTDGANATFDLTIEKMKKYAASRDGQYGLYFETGQGADFTNGHGNGFDMVLHESRKYGFARSPEADGGRPNGTRCLGTRERCGRLYWPRSLSYP